MKTSFAKWTLGTAALLTLKTALAANIWQDDNRFSVSAVFGLNMRAHFSNLQPLPTQNPGPFVGTQGDRFYDNGFVRLDISDNQNGQTTFWGYQNNSQYNAQAGTLSLDYNAPVTYGRSVSADDAPQMGVEFGYVRRLLRIGDDSKPWMIVGLEASFAFLDLSIHDTTHFSGNQIITDTFSLGGNVPPLAPYAGTFEGPGPLLNAQPVSRSFSTGAGMADLENRLDGQLWNIKFGPSFELPFSRRLSLSLGGGLSVVEVDGTYSYRESATLGGLSSSDSASSGFRSWDAGVYAKGELSCRLGDHWQAQAGVTYQSMGQFTALAGKYQGRLDLRDAVFATVGLGYAF